MKPKMSRRELSNNNLIWDAVINVLSEGEDTEENDLFNEAFSVYQYYSAMEGGGHENLFNWCSEEIEEKGVTAYIRELSVNLEKIGAHEYANIVEKYVEELWRLFIKLENEEIEDVIFLDFVEKADQEYYNLDKKLDKLLEKYFISIHTKLIDVVEN
ncbi:DMP19 family protein [Viridibacillus arvi]|uniref:DMP19 family protein n=1 Tax=Viridibacillus arvi TaxID=263475 RepID=UPI003D2E6851